ncbi:helix-turn-helix domain-containing protein [Macrococcoides caseolyticum]|uniref:helix-turn-helix domain-containing protein n=1 Tax=Macrococcoides caseolyticum TaxID=69966 RepID=UPI000C1596DE|nr:helix-turn-helix transcriptional regulator [Macrococcus caseolyticus]RAI80822.1 XRE family transcriptional regulator [Macrococcus caseolyticus subsp. hominis]TDM17085.1 XRE family transcriptional regulator [Macrococcus caseolyticus]
MIKVNLKKILKDRGITLSELSEGTGISLRGLSAFQNQKTDGVKYNTIEAICRYLDIEVSDLLKKYENIYNITCSIDLEDFDLPTNVPSGKKEYLNGKLIISNEIEEYIFNFDFSIAFEYKNGDYINVSLYIYKLQVPKALPKNISDFIDINNHFEEESAFYKIFAHLISQECMLLKNFPTISVWEDLWVKFSNDVIPPFRIIDVIADETMFSNTSEKLVFPKKEYRINTIPANPKEKITDEFGFVKFNIDYIPNFNSLISLKELNNIIILDNFKRDLFIHL